MEKRLRIGSRDDYCQVWELVGEVLDTTWIERDGELTRADPDPADGARRLLPYTLRREVNVVRELDGPER
ncbi:hypothetical protein [Sorangium sp. So ce124]|uniref:hypothetical protein n=1 Tax=Sorangium sp. So ce124 TaxID=3133280 RepID=UPI003F5D7DFF